MYAGKRSRLFLLGRTPAEGLDRLCSETPVEEWPQQLPPLRTGPQLLLKATPRVPVHDASSAASQALKYSVLNSGPVLACVDLGDVWRVFRSWSPTSLMAPLVPMLVDKSNGDLYNDWPFRSGGPTAQDAFLRLLQEVGPRLRELGFQGSGTGWRHSDADRYLCLVFIRFRSSTAVASTFYLTASIIAKEHWEQLRAEDPGLPSQPPTTGYQGTRFEIGQHHGMPVRFHVLAGADNNWMAGCVLDTIERVILSQASRTQEG